MSVHRLLSAYCEAGGATERPCTRMATTRAPHGMPLCDEHAHAVKLGEVENSWFIAQERCGEWLWLARIWGRADLIPPVENVRAVVAREHARAVEEMEEAQVVADLAR